MFTVSVKQSGNTATVMPQGMLNARSATDFEAELAQIPQSATKVILDCKDLQYTSSAGLRVIIALQTRLDKCNGSLVIRNLNDVLRETFDSTGFYTILTIE